MTAIIEGFTDELIKVAGPNVVARLIARLKSSPELRRSIARAAMLGGSTGVAAQAVQGDISPKDLLRAAGVGAATGGLTGAAFPAWFHHHNMRAPDEFRRVGLFRRKVPA